MSPFNFPSRVDVINVDSIGDPAFVVDTHGVIVNCNQEAEWFFGRSADRVIGQRCYSVVRACLPTGEPACSADCPLIQGLGVMPGPPAVELVARGGGRPASRFAINVQHIPLSNPRGNPSGLLHILTLAGPADEEDEYAGMSMGANYLG
ncbi:MAG: fold [Chloroflexota bacterium]|nr:fold [Chloroflexota bacterium]